MKQHKKVLILEDYYNVSHLIYVELKYRHIEAVEAESFADACLLFQNLDNSFDWILSEYELNHNNTGVQFIEWAEKYDPIIKSILISNEPDRIKGHKNLKRLKGILSKFDPDFFGSIEKLIKGA